MVYQAESKVFRAVQVDWLTDWPNREKDVFWRIVLQCANRLPPEKPRYCMGIGYGEDLLVCAALGVDMADCVFPTRTAVS